MRNRGLLLLTVLTWWLRWSSPFPPVLLTNGCPTLRADERNPGHRLERQRARIRNQRRVPARADVADASACGFFTGKAHYDISGTPVSGFFESEVTLSLGGTLTLSNLSASVPLQMFEEASNIAGLRGNASLQFERLELTAGRAAAMDGSVDIANLSVPILGDTSLGGYRAEFYTQNNGIVASVEDTDGVVDVAGSLQLNPDKTYAFRGQVVAKPNTPESLTNQLRYLPDERPRAA